MRFSEKRTTHDYLDISLRLGKPTSKCSSMASPCPKIDKHVHKKMKFWVYTILINSQSLAAARTMQDWTRATKNPQTKDWVSYYSVMCSS